LGGVVVCSSSSSLSKPHAKRGSGPYRRFPLRLRHRRSRTVTGTRRRSRAAAWEANSSLSPQSHSALRARYFLVGKVLSSFSMAVSPATDAVLLAYALYVLILRQAVSVDSALNHSQPRGLVYDTTTYTSERTNTFPVINSTRCGLGMGLVSGAFSTVEGRVHDLGPNGGASGARREGGGVSHAAN